MHTTGAFSRTINSEPGFSLGRTGAFQLGPDRRSRHWSTTAGLEDQTTGHLFSRTKTLRVCYPDTPNRLANGATDNP
jgi:hypothetical protein